MTSLPVRAEVEMAATGSEGLCHQSAGLDYGQRLPGATRLPASLEIKTVWHPTGAVSLGGGGGY